MLYIIDGHNAAGRLGMWKDRDYKQSLIRRVAIHKPAKGHRYELVFDGPDRLGDMYEPRPRLRVLATPSDGRYDSADDQVVALVRRSLKQGETAIAVVTDDRELGARAKALAAPGAVSIISVTDFFRPPSDGSRGDERGDRPGLTPEEVARINKELLAEWKDQE